MSDLVLNIGSVTTGQITPIICTGILYALKTRGLIYTKRYERRWEGGILSVFVIFTQKKFLRKSKNIKRFLYNCVTHTLRHHKEFCHPRILIKVKNLHTIHDTYFIWFRIRLFIFMDLDPDPKSVKKLDFPKLSGFVSEISHGSGLVFKLKLNLQ